MAPSSRLVRVQKKTATVPSSFFTHPPERHLGTVCEQTSKKPGSLSEFLLSLLRWLLSDRVEDELGPTPAAMFEEGPFALFCISSGARFMRRG